MIDKCNSIFKWLKGFLYSLQDVRKLGLLVFVVVVLLVSWSGLKAIDTNYGLQRQIAVLQQQQSVQKLKNNNLKLQNEYYNSDQYLELSARQNFGLAAPGEKEVLVPQKVALSYTVSEPRAANEPAMRVKQSVYARNFQAWVNFFLHRQPSSN